MSPRTVEQTHCGILHGMKQQPIKRLDNYKLSKDGTNILDDYQLWRPNFLVCGNSSSCYHCELPASNCHSFLIIAHCLFILKIWINKWHHARATNKPVRFKGLNLSNNLHQKGLLLSRLVDTLDPMKHLQHFFLICIIIFVFWKF